MTGTLVETTESGVNIYWVASTDQDDWLIHCNVCRYESCVSMAPDGKFRTKEQVRVVANNHTVINH